MDEHVGAGGAVEEAEGTFNSHPTLTFGAINAETNAGEEGKRLKVQFGIVVLLSPEPLRFCFHPV